MHGIGEAKTLIQMSQKDFETAIENRMTKVYSDKFISRFENVIVNTKDVAKIHSVSEQTVLNYINDGLVTPEVKTKENQHHRFRLSYVLDLDFRELQKQLRVKNRGW